jgi:hypothetical protein
MGGGEGVTTDLFLHLSCYAGLMDNQAQTQGGVAAYLCPCLLTAMSSAVSDAMRTSRAVLIPDDVWIDIADYLRVHDLRMLSRVRPCDLSRNHI